MKRLSMTVLLAAIVVGSSAHIGSPDVFFDGKAGPYQVNVRIFPPSVVPGTAWVYVRSSEKDIDSINVRPVYWRAGVKGAPPAERALPLLGQPDVFAQKMWLMSRGSYSVSVEVSGKRGQHSVLVPVMALATTRLGLSPRFAAMLAAFGLILLGGLVSIVRAGASDSLVEAGVEPDQVARRRGSLGALIAVPILLIAVFAGARWWKAEDTAFQQTIFRPLAATAIVANGPRAYSLRLSVRDTGSQDLLSSPLMLDHGKDMHLFLVKESSMSAFAHLHPKREPPGVFVSAIPPLPAGRYFVFGNIVLETGAEFTAATMIDVPTAKMDTLSDPDDSWIDDAFGVPAVAGARARLDNSLVLQWDTPDSLVAGRDVTLRFSVRNPRGAIMPIEPYMGMAAHAVVVRDDASVFVHLHPMGTMSAASLQAFDLRDRGDTAPTGRLKVPAVAAMSSHTMATPAPGTTVAPEMSGTFSFPYAFPKAGRYRMWVQVKRAGRVMTADYEVMVR